MEIFAKRVIRDLKARHQSFQKDNNRDINFSAFKDI